MMLDTGKVIAVFTGVGSQLAVVKCCFHPANDPTNVRYVFSYRGQDFCGSYRSILDLNPTCPTCGAGRWWWTEWPDLFADEINCVTCFPPSRRWEAGLVQLAKAFDQVSENDPFHNRIRDALILADEAWSFDQWVRFLEVSFAIRCGIATQQTNWWAGHQPPVEDY
jgi:hypothetical protein